MNFNLSTGIVHVHAIFRLRMSISESHCVIRSVIARAMTVIQSIQNPPLQLCIITLMYRVTRAYLCGILVWFLITLMYRVSRAYLCGIPKTLRLDSIFQHRLSDTTISCVCATVENACKYKCPLRHILVS